MSHVYARPRSTTSSAYRVANGLLLPKFWLSIAPHSPLDAKLGRSQLGTKSRVASVHDRFADVTDVVTGAMLELNVPELSSRYRPTDSFSAVRPVPVRSYETPS